jgi:hypothetical protein
MDEPSRLRGPHPQHYWGMDPRSWLGGLVTGEGCFCFSVQRVAARRGKLRITPIFSMFMADRETVNTAAEICGDLGLPVYMQERPKAGRDQVGLHIGGLKRVRRYCEELLPVLSGQKMEAASLVLQFIDLREQKPKGAPYSEPELAIVRNLRNVNGNTNGRKNPL